MKTFFTTKDTKDTKGIRNKYKAFRTLLERTRREREDRIKNAPKHKCVRESIGTLSIVSPKRQKIGEFFWCRICHKDMTSPRS